MKPAPEITVNGFRLTSAQANTMRDALLSFAEDLKAGTLGDDAHGKRMAEAYLANCNAILVRMRL